MSDIYLKDELKLKRARLILVNDQITVQVGFSEYQNAYTAFSFDTDNHQLLAPNYALTVDYSDSKRLHQWLMDLLI